MTLSRRLEDYLHRQGVRYVEHANHPGGRGMAKVMPLRDRNGDWIIAVLPEPLLADLEALAVASRTNDPRPVSERDRIRRFGPEAPTAFAELVGVPVYVDNAFGDESHIYFEAVDHPGVIGLRLQDYVRVARPSLGRFARAVQGG